MEVEVLYRQTCIFRKHPSQWIQNYVRPRGRVELNRQTYLIFHISSDLCVAATLFIICNWFLYSFHVFSTDSDKPLWRNLSKDGKGVLMFYKWVYIGFTHQHQRYTRHWDFRILVECSRRRGGGLFQQWQSVGEGRGGGATVRISSR